mgnify:CR=1 FL=1
MGLFGGGGAPETEKNTLRANSIVRLLDLICEGPVRGPVNGQRGIYFDGTPVKGADGRQNVQGVEIEFRNGSADFADCLHVALATQAGEQPLWTFDKGTAKVSGAQLLAKT